MTRQEQQRSLRRERRVQRGGGIGVPLAARDQSDAGLAGQPPPGVGHVDAGSLVPDMHDIDARRDQRVEHRHDVVARQGEDPADAEIFERLRDDVGSA